MTPLKFTATPDDSLAAVADRALAHVTGVPVLEGGRCVGVLSKKDVARVSADALATATVRDAMSAPAIVISPTTTAAAAAAACLRHKVHRLPVVTATGEVVGMVTRTDLVHVLSEM